MPTVDAVDDLLTEEDELKFIQAFRELIRVKNVMECFTEFSFDDLPIDEQLFADYRSKYLDLYDKVRSDRQKEKVSILDDIDFELELISRDKINVSYIIALLQAMMNTKPEERQNKQKAIIDILDTDTALRSKKELIEQFISKHFSNMQPNGSVAEEFEDFWEREKDKALAKISEEEKLDKDGLENVIGQYLFTEKPPMRDDVISLLQEKPSLKERKSISTRIIEKIKDFVTTFIDGVD